MFETETEGLIGIGEETEALHGTHVVLGLVDGESGELIGWFGDEYHQNHRGQVDEVGGEDDSLNQPIVVIGIADEDDNVIGWFGSKFLKKATSVVKKTVTVPFKAAVKTIKAPIKAAVSIARGKPVLPALTRIATAPVTGGARMIRSTISPIAGKKVARAMTSPLTFGVKATQQIARGKPIVKSLKGAVTGEISTQVTGAKAAVSQAKTGLRVAAPVIKSPVTKAVVGAVAIVYPPVGLALAAGLTAANLALPAVQKATKASTLALATADKVLAAAKGVMPAQKTAPRPVAKALQTAAKKSIAATYALARQGNPDAKRGIQVLVAAKKVQDTLPRIQKMIPAPIAVASGTVHQGNLVTKEKRVIRGRFQKQPAAGAGTTEAPVILSTGIVVKAAWKSA